MSASKDRQLRKQQIEAGLDKRTLAAAEEAKKRRKSNITYAVVAIVLVIFFAFIFIYNSSFFQKHTTAATIDGEDYTVAQVDYYYSMSYMNFYSNYYSYISYFFDPETSLADQMYSEDMSWRDYFLEQAVHNMREIQVLNNAAAEAGFVLPEETQAEYEEAVQQLETNWESLGYSSLGQYLAINYGKGVTEDLVKEELYRSYVANAYYQSVYDGFEISDEEVAAYYAEHADELDILSFAYYTTTDKTEAEAIADAVNGTDEETFAEYLSENYEAEPVSLSYAGSSLSSVYSGWLLDPARSAGDVSVLSDAEEAVEDAEDAAEEDAEDAVEEAPEDAVEEAAEAVEEAAPTYYVVMFLDRNANDYYPVSFRHILVSAEDTDGDGAYSQEELDAAEAEVQSIYEEWLAGDATEESFGELANTYSTDSGSNTNGGLYETVIMGQMVDPINDWLFEEGRQPGDTTIVTYDGAYTGAHAVYFVGADEQTYAYQTADTTLRSEAASEWLEELKTAAGEPVTSHLNMCGKAH